ncbi:MAG: hypothetical protein BWY74_01688 [Firmicutes bacterium ADurb.Bin419]|nr:MAG: hypothetical protein BWY74_01688 [Firmicutes bacterium ADurb.Bin419]
MYNIYVQFLPNEVVAKLDVAIEEPTADDISQYNDICKEPKIKIDIMDKMNMCSEKFNAGINAMCEDIIEYDDYMIITGTEYVPMMAIDNGAKQYAIDAISNFIEQRIGKTSGICIISRIVDTIIQTGPIARIADYVCNYTDEFGGCYMPQTEKPIKIVVSEKQAKKK